MHFFYFSSAVWFFAIASFVLVSFGLVWFLFFFKFYFPFRENQSRSLYSKTALYAQLCSLAIIKTIKFSLPLDFNSSRFVALKKKKKIIFLTSVCSTNSLLASSCKSLLKNKWHFKEVTLTDVYIATYVPTWTLRKTLHASIFPLVRWMQACNVLDTQQGDLVEVCQIVTHI